MSFTQGVIGMPEVASATPIGDLQISVIVPVFNEQQSIQLLCERLFPVLDDLRCSFEVIFVNDGSTDQSLRELRDQAFRREEIRVIDFRRNFGQTAAIMAGIDHARGEVLVSLDADLQNDPADIPMLLEKLQTGYDVVSGWRKDRKDAPIRRTLISRLANLIISRISGVPLKDYGCTLKAYRREVLAGTRLYGEMHRFIPIYASWMGARVAEIPVRHHPRRYGTSNYGIERVLKVTLDLIVVKFLDRMFVKPIYVFGGFGLFAFGISGLAALLMLWLKIWRGVSMILTPLPLLTALALILGVMSILMGLVAELLVRTYFESQHRAPYAIKQFIGFPDR